MIVVHGTTKQLAPKVRRTIQSCINYLMPRLADKLEIEVEFSNLGDANAYCTSDDDYSRPDRPRSFLIEVDERLSEDDVLLAVCHEMVHVKQYARSELYYAGGDRIRWKGEWVNDIPYEEQGWEREAYATEGKLLALAKCYL